MTTAVTVVIPTKNRGSLLAAAVRSAVDAGALEIVVADGGSTDGSIERVAELPGVHIVQGSFENAAATRNAGVAAARGEYLAFLDSDDEMTPAKLPTLVEALESDDRVGLVHGRTIVVDEHGAEQSAATEGHTRGFARAERLGTGYPQLAAFCSMYTSATLVRRSAFEAVGGYDESLGVYEDWDFYLRLSLDWKLVYRTPVVARYRIWSGNVSWDRTAAAIVEVAGKHLRDPPPLSPAEHRAATYAFQRRIAEASHVLVRGEATRRAAVAAVRASPVRALGDRRLAGLVARSLLPTALLRARRPSRMG
jgi:glycosyltransferase involved in cell wall biosynthesis